MYSGKKFPKDIINDWPEVFEEITCKTIPLEYLDSIVIKFKNQSIWEINVADQKITDWVAIEDNLREVLLEYKDELILVDFKLDTKRIKKDIIKKTKLFLKKRKLK